MKIWFQNRRTKWKKQENISSAEAAEHKLSAEKHLLKNAKNKKQAEKAAISGAAPPLSSLPATSAALASAATAAEPADASPAVSSNSETTPTAMDTSVGSGAGVLCGTGGVISSSTGSGSNPFPLFPNPAGVAATSVPPAPTLTDTATSPGPVLDLSMDVEEQGEGKVEEEEESDHKKDTCHGEERNAEDQHGVSLSEHVRESPVNLVVVPQGIGRATIDVAGRGSQQGTAEERDAEQDVDNQGEVSQGGESRKEPNAGADFQGPHSALTEDNEEHQQRAQTELL